jgi:uncharacterized protein (DUF1015 family)
VQTLPGSGLALASFRGVRYARDRVSSIANVTSPPYDVINGSVLDHLRAADPHNVVRLILPGEQASANQAAAAMLRQWLSSGVLVRDQAPALYLYEQHLPDHGYLQRGIIGLVRLGAGILPHEDVMPGPVAGRRELMAATRANLEPIFLIYDGDDSGGVDSDDSGGVDSGDSGGVGGGDSGDVSGIVDRVAARRAPLVAVGTEDGVTHRLWRLDDPAERDALAADLAGRRALIADGHHRYAAYLDLQAEMRAREGSGPWDYGLAFLVDSAACPPLLGAIHRVLPGLPLERAAELAKGAFTVQDVPAGLDEALRRLAAAGRQGTAFLLAGAAGFRLLSHPDPVQVAASMPADASAAWRGLDAAVLQQLLLGRLWGIPDSEKAVLIDHDAADAVRSVRSEGTAVICNPPTFDEVIAVAAHGERVPRKSTSFGPKPRTGLLLRTLDP